jgi:hypothetical protein
LFSEGEAMGHSTQSVKFLGIVVLLALAGGAQAFDIPPLPPPPFQDLIVPLHPQGPCFGVEGTPGCGGRSSRPRAAVARPKAAASSLLAAGPSQVAANAAQLAQVFPAAQREAMVDAYKQSFATYRQLEAKLGVPPDDVAGAVAAYIAGNYMALRNVEVPDEHFRHLVAQMRSTLADKPAFLSAPAHQKRLLYEQLAMVGTFMAVARQAFVKNPNPAAEQNFRDAAQANLEMVFKQPVDRLQITAQGMSLP